MPLTLLNNSNKKKFNQTAWGNILFHTRFRNLCWKMIPEKRHVPYRFIWKCRQVLFLLSRRKYVITVNAGRTALWNESNSNKLKYWNVDLFYLDPFPQSFCICDSHCFTHQSLLPVFHWHPKDINMQYNSANSHPLGEYEFKVKINRVLS